MLVRVWFLSMYRVRPLAGMVPLTAIEVSCVGQRSMHASCFAWLVRLPDTRTYNIPPKYSNSSSCSKKTKQAREAKRETIEKYVEIGEPYERLLRSYAYSYAVVQGHRVLEYSY